MVCQSVLLSVQHVSIAAAVLRLHAGVADSHEIAPAFVEDLPSYCVAVRPSPLCITAGS